MVDVDITGDKGVGGLIGIENDANISYVHVDGDIAGVEAVGGILGRLNTDGYLSYSNANVVVLCDTSAGLDCGGLVGDGSGNIDSSYSLGSVTSFTYVGGLVGDAMFSIITNSYSGADTYSTSDSNPYQGGLLGDAEFCLMFLIHMLSVLLIIQLFTIGLLEVLLDLILAMEFLMIHSGTLKHLEFQIPKVDLEKQQRK